MASEVKADKLSPSGGTALQIGDASDTITIPTGATLTITDGLGVAGGGTGLVSFTAGDILYASGTTTLTKLAKGSAEQVLAMNSGATAPDWGSVDLTVLPTITAAKGGTGQTSYTTGDIVYASGSTAISKLGVGTARQALQTNSGATAPEWVNSPQSLMTAAGDILYASGANTLAKLAKGSDDEVLTLASGVPSWAEAGTGGKIGQVVSAIKTDGTTTSSTTATTTGLQVAITPTATSSKVMLMCAIGSISNNNAGSYSFSSISGGNAATYLGDAATGHECAVSYYMFSASGADNHASIPGPMMYLDSPATTSEVTYVVNFWAQNNTAHFNTTSDGSATAGNCAATITAMEVLA